MHIITIFLVICRRCRWSWMLHFSTAWTTGIFLPIQVFHFYGVEFFHLCRIFVQLCGVTQFHCRNVNCRVVVETMEPGYRLLVAVWTAENWKWYAESCTRPQCHAAHTECQDGSSCFWKFYSYHHLHHCHIYRFICQIIEWMNAYIYIAPVRQSTQRCHCCHCCCSILCVMWGFCVCSIDGHCFTIHTWTNGVFHFLVLTVQLSIGANTTSGSTRSRDRFVIHLQCLIQSLCNAFNICHRCMLIWKDILIFQVLSTSDAAAATTAAI